MRLKDIAEHLDISVSTVSRVINNRDRVDEQTRSRVLATIEEFGYVPNEVARSLKRSRNKAVGIIVPDLENVFYAKVISGVETVMHEAGYYTIVCSSKGDAARELANVQMLDAMQISGPVMATVMQDRSYVEHYRNIHMPIVFVDNVPKDEMEFSSVVSNNYQAGCDLTKLLIENGHRDIGIIIGSGNESSNQLRMRGWAALVRDKRLMPRKEWIKRAGITLESGYEAMLQILSCEQQPTAVFVTNNIMAFGAAKAIREKGLRIPEDISMVAFDVNDDYQMIEPKFTCMVQPADEMGRIAASIIMRQVATQTNLTETIVTKAEFVPGESVRRLAPEKPRVTGLRAHRRADE